MKDLPWFPNYVDDWLGSGNVRRMTFAQRGLYHDMLCWQWKEGSLPRNPDEIARLLGAERSEVRGLLADGLVLRCFERCAGNALRNAKLHELREQRIASHKRLSEAGRKGGKASRKISPASSEASSTASDKPKPKQTRSRGAKKTRSGQNVSESKTQQPRDEISPASSEASSEAVSNQNQKNPLEAEKLYPEVEVTPDQGVETSTTSNDLFTWLGPHAHAVDQALTPLLDAPALEWAKVWGWFGPHGTRHRELRDTDPDRRHEVVASALLAVTSDARKRREIHQGFLASCIATAQRDYRDKPPADPVNSAAAQATKAADERHEAEAAKARADRAALLAWYEAMSKPERREVDQAAKKLAKDAGYSGSSPQMLDRFRLVELQARKAEPP